MDALIVKISLTYDSPVDHTQLQFLQDKFVEHLDAELNDGELSLPDAEVLDFDVEIERSEE